MTEYSGKNSQTSGLRPAAYQLTPLTKLLANRQKFVLICDGVGVGKTISAGYILTWAYAKTKQRSWIVCPPNLVHKWTIELEHRFGFRTTKVDSVGEFKTMEDEISLVRKIRHPHCYVIPNSLFHNFTFSARVTVPVIVFDEIHTYRNPDTRWHKTAVAFSTRAAYRVGLTATPINNGLDDLVSEIKVLIPDASRSALENTIHDLWVSERKRILNPFVTRFTKEKLGIHFARRMIRSVVVNYPSRYTSEVIAILRSRSRGSKSILDRITHFRMAASSPSAFSKALHTDRTLIHPDTKIEALKRMLKERNRPRWIIFCEFLETARLIAKSLTRAEAFLLTGDTPSAQRQEILQAFKETEQSVLVVTSIASEGIDLQFCDAIVNYDLHWNPMKLEQRIGRIDRIGQEKDTIYVVNLIVSGGIDERVASVIMKKLQLIKHSPFAVKNLFGNIRDQKDVRPMFDVDVLDHELDESEELLTAIHLSQEVLLNDYHVLPSIDLRFCDPSKLKTDASTGMPWIKRTSESSSWLRQIASDADRFRDILNYYS